MTVTRDVIYDLLPTYFAGDVSADTRTLVEEFFAGDPAFARMAERFRALLEERHNQGAGSEAARERVVFDRAKARVKLRFAALAWGMGAAFAVGVAALTGFEGRFGFGNPGTIIGAVFATMALLTWALSYGQRPERSYAAFVGSHQDE